MGELTPRQLSRMGKARCERCSEVKPTEQMIAIRVQFDAMKPRRTIKSITRGKVCMECVQADDDFRAEPRYI